MDGIKLHCLKISETMLKLAISVKNDDTLIYKSIKANNVYAFTYLLRFLKSTPHINLFEILSYTLERDGGVNNDKIIAILLNEMIKNDTLQNYVDYILELAIESNNIKIVTFLLESNRICPTYTLSATGKSLFEICVDMKSEILVNIMITKHQLNINTLDITGIPLVIRAVENESPQISSIFILGKCDLECINKNGVTLLELCIQRKWFLHVNYILGNGYKRIYMDSEYFHNMCHVSIENNSTLIFDKLVSNYFAAVIQKFFRRYLSDKKNLKNRKCML